MPTNRRYSTGRKILIGVVIFILIALVALQVFIGRYLTPVVRDRLSDVIIKGSDSLYRFESADFDVNFWGRSITFSNLHIRVDSTRYNVLKKQKKLPIMTFDLLLPKGNVNGIGFSDLVFKKKVDIASIDCREAQVKLSRHYRSSIETDTAEAPLWKLIQPGLRSIRVGKVSGDNVKVIYQNADNSDNFRWQLDRCDAYLSDIMIDSLSSLDTSRLLFAKNVELKAKDVKLKTSDGLYNLGMENASYSSSDRNMNIRNFSFRPALNDAAFIRHFGYQHEIYRLSVPVINIKDFIISRWIGINQLKAGTIELVSPVINVSLDRNARPNPYSKKGQYPNQLVRNAPFGIDVRKVTAVDGTLTYTERNNKNQLTGKIVFPSIRGTITNITNDVQALKRSAMSIVNVRSGILETGILHAVFRFNLADAAGAFSVNATINKLNAKQLQPLAKAMTSTDVQSFNLHKLEYAINGNQNAGTGDLRMRYDDMDILINQVEPDGSFDKKGLMSFFANRMVIYKENPMEDEAERTANNIRVQRDPTRSFFSFVWKTLFTSAGEIVIRPAAQRKMEKRKQREREAASRKK
jgi:hypothetical protein